MKQHASTAIITSLVFLFSYTSISKLFTFYAFKQLLIQMPFISTGAGILAWAVPTAELCIVLLLIAPATRETGLIASLTMLCGFTIFLLALLLSGLHLPCSCGGIISSMSWQAHVLFNLVMIALNSYALYKLFTRKHAAALA